MTRKLSSLLLSAFALLLLMGAGVEQDSTDGTSTSSGLTVAQLSERSKTSDQEADQAQAVTAAAGTACA